MMDVIVLCDAREHVSSAAPHQLHLPEGGGGGSGKKARDTPYNSTHTTPAPSKKRLQRSRGCECHGTQGQDTAAFREAEGGGGTRCAHSHTPTPRTPSRLTLAGKRQSESEVKSATRGRREQKRVALPLSQSGQLSLPRNRIFVVNSFTFRVT